MSDLALLLDIQDHDTEADQLRHRRASLPARGELADLERDLEVSRARQVSLEARRDELVGHQQALEQEIDDLSRRLSEVDKRLHSGAVTATRELTAMVEQTEMLKARRTQLEDRELEVMEELEPLEAELAQVTAFRETADAESARLRAALADAEMVIDAQLALATQARARAAEGLPAGLIATYERLRSRLGGVGAARLVGSSCGGCHLTIPNGELDHIRRQPPDALVMCEQCGRLLVR